MKIKSKGGFTLLELLVVIAIIGVFTTIVMASLNSARKKGEDASIQSTLKSIQTQSGLYFAQNGNYGATTAACGGVGTMFADSTAYGLFRLTTAAQLLTNNLACFSSSLLWVVSAELKSDPAKYWCIDNTGLSKIRSASATSTESLCGGY